MAAHLSQGPKSPCSRLLTMPALFVRLGLCLSLLVAVLAVFLQFQQPLQDFLLSTSATQTFCYSRGVTAKFSTGSKASCFTVKNGLFVDIFTPESELALEPDQGHAIPGLWDGVSGEETLLPYHSTLDADISTAWSSGCIRGVPPLSRPIWHRIHRGSSHPASRLRVQARRRRRQR